MIAKMKKVAVICLSDQKDQALGALRDVGVLHVESDTLVETEDRKAIGAELGETRKVFRILEEIASKSGEEAPPSVPQVEPEALFDRVMELDKETRALQAERQTLANHRLLLEPWGDFNPELLNKLRGEGISLTLCQGSPEDVERLPESLGRVIVKHDGVRVYFVVISMDANDLPRLPVASVPEGRSLAEVNASIDEIDGKLDGISQELASMIPSMPALKEHIEKLEERLEFAVCRDGMLHEGLVACIRGYCPEEHVKKLSECSKKHAWGLLLEEPSEKDAPPTLMTPPRIVRCSKAIFDFVGISPGYNEWDISACFLIFFTLFFSMIFGDAGYGLVFLVAAIFAKRRYRASAKLRHPLNLFLLLSSSTVLWGFINGNFFAIPGEHLPVWMRGLEWFTDPALKDKHVQLLCLGIAAVHLSFARFWKASLIINDKRALGEIGWGLVLWGNFLVARKLIVYPESELPVNLLYLLYGAGLGGIVLFGINWRRLDEAFGFFFGLSGTFVDLLSYIRLFAVGLSSYYIAKSFNDMGMMLLGASSRSLLPLMAILAAAVILFGHVLNVLLGFLGVLVHGIRLNTLEFSNHMGLQWLGHVYRPFCRRSGAHARDE